MSVEKKAGVVSRLIDGLLVAGAVGMLFFCGATILVQYPLFWGQCVEFLNVKYWGMGMWTGVAVAFLLGLLAIRFWPEKQPSGLDEPRETDS